MTINNVIKLNSVLLISSFSGIFSKLASSAKFLSLEYCIFQFGMIMTLGIYAILWQQIIKNVPLTTAYMNKAVTLVWGSLWGIIFFNEVISIKQVIGMVITIVGVVVFSYADAKEV